MIKLKIIILTVLFSLYGCIKKNEVTINANNSTKRIEKIISPEKSIGYTTKYIQVRGYSDDSIYVKFGENGLPFYFQKKIDTTISGDYYGAGQIKFIFDPYKSKKRDLQINFGIIGSK